VARSIPKTGMATRARALKWGVDRFAIFPSEAIGLRAVRRFLRKHRDNPEIPKAVGDRL
jgi:hypothetical protein